MELYFFWFDIFNSFFIGLDILGLFTFGVKAIDAGS
jgi:hypothetical protein